MKKKNPFLEPIDVDLLVVNQQMTPQEEAHLSMLIQKSKNKYKESQKKHQVAIPVH